MPVLFIHVILSELKDLVRVVGLGYYGTAEAAVRPACNPPTPLGVSTA